MRRLPALQAVHGRVIDRPTMLRQVRRQVREQVPIEAIRGESAFLTAFGLIPASFDYEAGVYRLIESQLAGYYDPDQKTMFLMGDLAPDEAEVTLAHELVHALQDQHYDLGPRLAYRKDANDAQAAIHALAEGDATSLMIDYSLARSGVSATRIPDRRLRLEIVAGMAMSPDMSAFPRVLRDSLLAPYVDGVLFVHALRRRGGWAAVDRAWRHPPTTTEQVLHVDKFDAHEPAMDVAVPRAPLQGAWQVRHTEVYGEQGLRIAMEEWMPRPVAVDAAAGWGGDRAAVFTQRDSGITVAGWSIRFDTGSQRPDSEAVDAFEAIASAWGKPPSRTLCHTVGAQRLAAARIGRDLALVAAPTSLVGEKPRLAWPCSRLSRWAATVAGSQRTKE